MGLHEIETRRSASEIRAPNMEQEPIRRATRVKTSIDVHWGYADICLYEGTIIDLTVLGCAVHNKSGVAVLPGQIVSIQFWMPSERILKVEVRHTKLQGVPGFGARFLDLTEADTETLEEMVQLFGEPQQDTQPED